MAQVNGLLETTVTTVAASAGTGGIYLNETDNLTIGSVAAIATNRVEIDGTPSTQAGSVLTGAVAATDVFIQAGNGIIVNNVVNCNG